MSVERLLAAHAERMPESHAERLLESHAERLPRGPTAEARVRPASVEDAERVCQLARALAALPLLVRYGVDAGRFGDELQRVVCRLPETTEQALLLAEINGKDGEPGELVGLARVLHGGAAGQFGRGGYLKLIALRSGYEGWGIGRLLLNAVEHTVAARSSELFLLTSDFNHGAQRFYERAGYRRVGELPDFVHAGISEIIYWKRLAAIKSP
jgi:ribosomal protein S18 acetylase RimI-like enzyme